jgi:cytochrome c-type biogenesis protein CcmE
MDVSTPGASSFDDPESPDATPVPQAGSAGDFDLTPRTGPGGVQGSSAPGGRRSRRWMAVGALVVVLGALAFVLLRGIGDAATFFYNVDEAVERREELGEDRFRLQGNVAYGSVVETDGGVSFVLRFNGEEVPVEHTGTPPELFGPEIPVVLEGRFVGDTFASDEILIKHDSTYDEENPERIDDAEADVERGASAPEEPEGTSDSISGGTGGAGAGADG